MKHPHVPTADEIRNRRVSSDLSRDEAAALIHKPPRTWERWEQGRGEMHPAFWELFWIKTIRRFKP